MNIQDLQKRVEAVRTQVATATARLEMADAALEKAASSLSTEFGVIDTDQAKDLLASLREDLATEVAAAQAALEGAAP